MIYTSQTKWEYQDFVFVYPKNSMWTKIGTDGYTEATSRIEFWQASQGVVLTELQKWIDQGWQPVTEVGPASIQLHTYRSLGKGCLPVSFAVLGILSSFGVGLLFLPTFAEPFEVRIQMRRAVS